MAIEVALEQATARLELTAGGLDELSAAWDAADIGEQAALGLARNNLADAPGYLAAANAFADLRSALGDWAPPARDARPFADGDEGHTQKLLRRLSGRLVERLTALAERPGLAVDAKAIVAARDAAAEALDAVFGPVRDDVDVR